MRRVLTVALVLGIAMALLGPGAKGGVPVSEAAPGMDRMAIDMDPTATPPGTPTSIGTVEICARVDENNVLDGSEVAVDTIEFDVIADNIPVLEGMIAYSYALSYPSPDSMIVAQNINGLLSMAPGATLLNSSSPLPSAGGLFLASVADVGVGAGVSGSGFLDRLRLETVPGATAGVFPLTLSNAAHIDINSIAHAPVVTDNATVAIGVPCSSQSSQMDAMSIDMDPSATPANTASGLGSPHTEVVGSREVCARINENNVLDGDEDVVDTLEVDVTAEGVPPYNAGPPASGAMIGYSYTLNFSSANLTVQTQDFHFMIEANAGSAPLNASQITPANSPWSSSVADTGPIPGSSASGTGVLDRLGVSSDAGAVAGLYPLGLTNNAHIDVNGVAHAPNETRNATVAIDTRCPVTVDSSGDGADSNPGDGVCDDGAGSCTLRAAIQETNHPNSAGLDTINFDVGGGGVATISPGSALPTITDPVVIDGYTQPGASANTNPITSGSNAVLRVELDGGTVAPGADGLRISGGGSTVRGLVIHSFTGSGVRLETANGGNTVQGNFIGTDVDGAVDMGNAVIGVRIENSPSNEVGGLDPEDRNVISGNAARGVYINGAGATLNLVRGNLIGTDAAGTIDLGNSIDGVTIWSSAANNTVGGATQEARNVISGNDSNGIVVSSGATGNTVQGNFIGTTINGTNPLGNTFSGVALLGAVDTVVGGGASGEGNVISGNGSLGVQIIFASTTGNEVEGNHIGTDVNGTAALGNGSDGIRISNGATSNTIGGGNPGQGNAIAHNTGDGVRVDGAGTLDNPIRGNSIHSNGGKGIENINGGAGSLAPPTITVSNATTTDGTSSCFTCPLDVYSDDADEGRIYHDWTTTDVNGDWSFSDPVTGPNVTATVTDATGNTSEFSAFACVDTDGDTICNSADPDDDNDGVYDDAEDNCDGDRLDANIRPERIDGIFAGVSDDGDVDVDEALPPGSETFDCDGDGYVGTAEAHVYDTPGGATTADQDPCGTNSSPPTVPPTPPTGWPADLAPSSGPIVSNNRVNIMDIVSFLSRFGTADLRWDLVPGPGPFLFDINILDLTSLIALTPPMLGAAYAMNGPDCPWP